MCVCVCVWVCVCVCVCVCGVCVCVFACVHGVCVVCARVHRESETETERGRQTDRQTDRQTELPAIKYFNCRRANLDSLTRNLSARNPFFPRPAQTQCTMTRKILFQAHRLSLSHTITPHICFLGNRHASSYNNLYKRKHPSTDTNQKAITFPGLAFVN